jgi:hypothetical protein
MRVAYFIRLALIIGAAACFVIGVKGICEAVAYHASLDPIVLLIMALPFVPIIMMAPSSMTAQKHFRCIFTGLLEAVVIVSNFFLVWR